MPTQQRKRYRVYERGLTVGTSVYAHHFQASEDGDIEFCDENGNYVAVFAVENVTKIMTGPTADDLVYSSGRE